MANPLRSVMLLVTALLIATTTYGQNNFKVNESILNGANGFTITNVSSGGIHQAITSGDFNGDGIDDFITGDGSDETYLFFGKRGSNFSSEIITNNFNGSNGYKFNGIDSRDFSGMDVGAADVNGDGTDDVIINAYFADPHGKSQAGETYLIFGDKLSTLDNADGNADGTIELSNLDSSTGYIINGIDAGDQSGESLAAGDIDGDGKDDLLLGSRLATVNGNDYAGETYLLYGDQLNSLDGADGNTDGVIELVNLNGTYGYILQGNGQNDQAGAKLSVADFNGDGHDELLIGARLADADGVTEAGLTYVVLGDQLASADAADGGSTGIIHLNYLDGTTGYLLNGIDANDRSGYNVFHGDFNGDGIEDIMTTALEADAQSTYSVGELYILFGGQLANADAIDNSSDGEIQLENLNGTLGFMVQGVENGHFGGGISEDGLGAGDINNDGADEILVGNKTAYRYGDSNRGITYVIFGRKNDPFPASIRPDTLNIHEGFALIGAQDMDAYSGSGVVAADIDDDGFDDVLVVAPGVQDNTYYGKVYNFTYPVFEEQIDGSEGFHMMSAPVSGNVYSALLDNFWTQGFTGADAGDSYDDNTWIWLETADTDGDWRALSDINYSTLSAGQGFLFYLFDDQDNDGTAEGFPKTLSSLNLYGNISFVGSTSYNTGTVNPVSSLGDGRFYLAGNPYWDTIDWDKASGWTKTNLSSTIYVWDQQNGKWQDWNGTTGSKPDKGLIEPYQGFFIQASGGSGSLSINENAISNSEATYYKQNSRQQPLALELKLSAKKLKDQTFLQFDKRAKPGTDRLDGIELQPLSSRYLQLFSKNSSGRPLDINALPADQKKFSIPLRMTKVGDETTSEETATLQWSGLKKFPDEWTFILVDMETNKEVELVPGHTTEVIIQSVKATASGKQGKISPRHSLQPHPVTLKGKNQGYRYQLRVETGNRQEENEQVPTAVDLDQNYPNPFNPSTHISYDVPEKTEVTLKVYDMLGQKVATLVNSQKSPGHYDVNFDASGMNLASGLYVYRLKVGSEVLTKKMTLIK